MVFCSRKVAVLSVCARDSRFELLRFAAALLKADVASRWTDIICSLKGNDRTL